MLTDMQEVPKNEEQKEEILNLEMKLKELEGKNDQLLSINHDYIKDNEQLETEI